MDLKQNTNHIVQLNLIFDPSSNSADDKKKIDFFFKSLKLYF